MLALTPVYDTITTAKECLILTRYHLALQQNKIEGTAQKTSNGTITAVAGVVGLVNSQASCIN
jgi:hypothetical protein